MLLGFLLIYLGTREVLELPVDDSDGFGHVGHQCWASCFSKGGKAGTLFIDPLMSNPNRSGQHHHADQLAAPDLHRPQQWPIACFVFMGIGVLLDVGYVMARPFQSMFIALFAELGTTAVPDCGVSGYAASQAAGGHHWRGRRPDGAVHLTDSGPKTCLCRSPWWVTSTLASPMAATRI